MWPRKSLISVVRFSLDDKEEGAFRELSESATRFWVCSFEVRSESAGGTSIAIIYCLLFERRITGAVLQEFIRVGPDPLMTHNLF